MIKCTFENGNIAAPGLRHITVNAIVIQNIQVLLGLRADVKGLGMKEIGKWALIGGFLSRDESIVDAVKREVMEESGWEIDQLSLFRINDNPNRPHEDRQNVDMIFIANAVKQVGTNDEEVKELRWFPLDQLPSADQIAFDHGQDMQMYLDYLKNPRTLPILS